VNLSKEEKVGFKTPLVMSGMALLVLYFFGISGRPGEVAFELSRRQDAIQLPSITIDSMQLGTLPDP